MALARTAYQKLLAWKQRPQHKALLISGARQVGKTYLVREFARAEYGAFLEINFIETPSAVQAFEGDLDAQTIITNLSVYAASPLVPGNTLVFLDEVQMCPRARTAIKFLVDDGRFDYIESGSLLGVTYQAVPSIPVGYEEQLQLMPLSLSEFFGACGIQREVLDHVGGCVRAGRPVPEPIHSRLLRLFRIYMAVGGMPAAVQAYVDSFDLAAVLQIQRDVLALYRQDIARYAPDKPHVHRIFDAIPAELDKKNKRFMLSDLAKSARMNRYESDFMWLVDAGVGLPCYNATAPVVPLAVNVRRNLFKLFLCDVGLLAAAAVGPVQRELIQGDLSINWGSFLENAVAQQLAACGIDLYYYDKSKIGEVDFLVQRAGRVVPLEAKSGAVYTKHRALDNLMAVEEWGLAQGVVLCGGNVAAEGRLVYVPWYALACLEVVDADDASFVVEL